ncbi:SGNH/GDSL hydrolase family protein [Nocardia paucivorans]|uniref:SGNH/GDSL hydrolase family protein n=1 Tax=Nocardia paucivorans TaxID=114259 RepID=UPI000318735F|nr:SGNH/GDSL hydrolase family protein [Nocardia paucivorans]
MTHTEPRTETNDPLVIPTATARELLSGVPWRRYAVLGDSIAQGIGDPSPGYRPCGWAERVVDALTTVQPELRYLNTGRMGATSAQVLAEQVPRVLDFRPDLVHVICGGNDLFAHTDLVELRANLDAIFSALTDTGALLCTFTMADVWDVERMAPMRPMRTRMADLNDVIRETATRYDALLVDFWDHPLRLRPDLMSDDLIHFTTGGHAVVASEVIRALGRVG